MMKSLLTAASAALLCCPAFCAEQAHQPSGVVDPYAGNIVRLSKIKVDPAQLDAYKAFAAEVGRESMKLEPGVRVLYSMQEQRDPTQFYILEIYASQQPTKATFSLSISKNIRKAPSKWFRNSI